MRPDPQPLHAAEDRLGGGSSLFTEGHFELGKRALAGTPAGVTPDREFRVSNDDVSSGVRISVAEYRCRREPVVVSTLLKDLLQRGFQGEIQHAGGGKQWRVAAGQ